MQALKLRELIVVEGKYDKIRLQSVIDATIVTTEGFGIYRDTEKKAYIRRLAAENGVVILTDSDKAGFQLRNYLKKLMPDTNIIHIYIPDVFGKEPRKARKSAEGKLGVEGISCEVLRVAFEKAGLLVSSAARGSLRKADLYALGLSGCPDSAEKRKAIAKKLQLPEHISANALLEALNRLYTDEERSEALRSISSSN